MPGPLLFLKGSHSLNDLMHMPCEDAVDLAVDVSACTSVCREVMELAKPLCHLWAVTGAGYFMIILQRACD